MFSATQSDNGLHDLDLETHFSTAQVDTLRDNADLVGPHLLGETGQGAYGFLGRDARATFSGQHRTGPTIDWRYATPPPPPAAADAFQQKEALLRHNDRLDWECSTLRGQLGAALGRAAAAEENARVAYELRMTAEERMRLAEESTRAAEERARVAEAAVVRLEEEAAASRAAAAANPMLPVVGEIQARSRVDSGSPPDFAAMYEASWQPLQCQQRLLEAMLQNFAVSYRAAKESLKPDNSMLHVEQELGRGGFGGVHKAVCAATGETWAVKKPVSETDKEALIYEMLVYDKLPVHPNILRVLSVYDELSSPALALECGECDFHRALGTGMMSFADELECMADVAKGTRHCHDNNIVVCDLKPSNVILVHDGTRFVGKLADFGLAIGIGRTRGPQCGTPGFFPAEVAYSSTLAEPSTDAVSVGAILAIVALQAVHREANVFAHEMFWTPEERLQLQQLAHTDHDGFRDKLATIGLRTMQLPDYGFAKKVTRPSVLNKMPGSSMMAVRKLIRTTTSANPADRPDMADVATELRAVASAVRLMTEAAGRSASAPAPESAHNPTTSNSSNDASDISGNQTNDIGSGSDGGGSDGSGSDDFSTIGSAEGLVLPPHVIPLAGSIISTGSSTGSSIGSDTVSSLGIGLPDEDEPWSVRAGAGNFTPASSLRGDMVLGGDSGGGSAAAPLFGSEGTGGGRANGVSVDGSGSDSVPAFEGLEGVVLLSTGLRFSQDGSDSRSPSPVATRAASGAERMGESVDDLFPAVVMAGAGGIAAVGGGGGGAPVIPILIDQPTSGPERGGAGGAACSFSSSVAYEEGLAGDEDEEEASWDWGWEWEGTGGESVAVGFGA